MDMNHQNLNTAVNYCSTKQPSKKTEASERN